jgi:MarR-like DNA-binding transcriptional regulator SgrR of sgrS sRNA
MPQNDKNRAKDETSERDQYFKDRAGTDEARFHVVPHDEEGWAVKTEGKDEPDYTTGSKPEAVKEAKRMTEEAGTMAIIHNEDGKIEDQHSYQ